MCTEAGGLRHHIFGDTSVCRCISSCVYRSTRDFKQLCWRLCLRVLVSVILNSLDVKQYTR